MNVHMSVRTRSMYISAVPRVVQCIMHQCIAQARVVMCLLWAGSAHIRGMMALIGAPVGGEGRRGGGGHANERQNTLYIFLSANNNCHRRIINMHACLVRIRKSLS